MASSVYKQTYLLIILLTFSQWLLELCCWLCYWCWI